MAFDGIVVANLKQEMNQRILDGRISKIAQPEADALLLTIKKGKETCRLFLSASPGLPLIYFTENNRPGPLSAPGFCMLLRKHIGNGKITAITQPGLERVLDLEIEHFNELGDLCKKHLMVEIMGKHSNIIFTDHQGKILDSIKHVSSQMSSVREVLPGRDYFIPETVHKENPLELSREIFDSFVCSVPTACGKALYQRLTGLSPLCSEELCFRAGVDSSRPANTLSPLEREALYRSVSSCMEEIKNGNFYPNILLKDDIPAEFSSIRLTGHKSMEERPYRSVSAMLEDYYAMKDKVTRIRQKSSDLRKIVQTALERNVKKYELQKKQLKDTEKREQYRVYGELLTAYGYEAAPGAKSLTVTDYYTGKEVSIPLDPALSPIDNAKRYFEKYGKQKRTFEALSAFIQETKEDMEHLESILTALDMAMEEGDLAQIRQELLEYGYIKKKGPSQKGRATKSLPLHYISDDGFHIYVGKNNYQNEELTFHVASGTDWWFHAKKIPGSHVIVKAQGKELPDRTFLQAASLAAYYSQGRNSEKVEIDYVQKKQVKKVAGARPGFVIYHTNYSMVVSPDIRHITQL